MRVLVTGGSGFIGSHVVDALLAAGMAPRSFDLRPSPHHSPEEVDCVIGDLLSPKGLREAMEGCDAVVHLAAAADVDVVTREPVAAEAVNATGTINVLEAARQAAIKRVVYASTIWVYGNATGTVDEDAAVVLPDHLYTATKLAGEMYCRSYSELFGLQCTVLRFGIPYGPRARPAGVIPIFVRKAVAGEPLTIAGEGLQSRRFVYVEDLAQGVVLGLAPQATLVAYLAAVHAIGLSSDDERTVGLLSIGALAAYLALGRHAALRLSSLATWAACVVSMCALLVVVVMPDLRESAGLGAPDAALVLVSLAGSALSLTLAGAAHGLRRRREQRATLPA